LGADVIGFDPGKSSVTKGESLVNTLKTLQALGTDVVVMRHPLSGAPYEAVRNCRLHVVNAGDGWHAHPSQSLLDIYTMRRHFGEVKGRTVAIIGDILHSRVARSNIWGLSLAGCKVILCGPPTLLPTGLQEFLDRCNLRNVSIETRVESAISGADVVMPLRLQLERQQSGLLPSIREYAMMYQVTQERMALASPKALVLHPGPINEDVEISSEVAHGPQSMIEEQVGNGLAVRMALLYLITGGER
jgi:aspartate carbamoyltransferase catalytic subunit